MANTELEKLILQKVMSNLGKLSHKKKPRPREFYVAMAKKGAEKRWGKVACGKLDNVIE